MVGDLYAANKNQLVPHLGTNFGFLPVDLYQFIPSDTPLVMEGVVSGRTNQNRFFSSMGKMSLFQILIN